MHKLFARSAFVGVVAALLSLVMVTPAVAEGEWVPDNKTMPADVRYKYGYDYYKTEIVNGKTYTYRLGDKIPVSPTVNPQNTGGQYYLNQIRDAQRTPSPTPIAGKIVSPTTTLVKPPSVIAPTSAWAAIGKTALGASKLLGTAGVGIGGASTPVANYKELALAAGIPEACVNTFKQPACTRAQQDTLFSISTCTHTATCGTVGAKDANGNPIDAFWKDGFVPFVDDLWAWLTGQAKPGEVILPNGHKVITQTRGCTTEFGWEPTGPQTGILHKTKTNIVTPKPTSGSIQPGYWESACGTVQQTKVAQGSAVVSTTCIEPATGKTTTAAGSTLGQWGAVNTHFNEDTGAPVQAMCTTPTAVILSLRIMNNGSYEVTNTGSAYSSALFSEWINPDPYLDQIEDTKITTTWDCRDGDGVVRTLSKTAAKTGGFIDPVCPPGTDLIKSTVTATEAGAAGSGTRTLDERVEAPGAAAAYPNCINGVGCTMNVHLDGVVCSVGKAGCSTWPEIYAQTPSRVGCMWGPYSMPVNDCLSLSNGYKSETGMVFDPRAETWIAVDAFGNPIQPNPEPWNPTNPAPSPGTAPTTGTTPGTSTPGTGTPGFPVGGSSPSDNCVSPTWSWNPVEWVKNPVMCALQDAFVPKVDISARLTTIQGQAATHPPFSWFAPVFTGPGGGGCPNWNIVLPNGSSVNAVCDSSFTAAILGVRGPMFGILSVAMVWPLMRSLWYAAIPILRVTPSGGK